MKGTGTENYGGPIVTAGGLVFIGATNFDRKFRALDKRSGRLLWETTLPLAGNATASLMKWPGSSRRPSTQLAEKAGEKIRPAAFTLHSYYLRR